MRKGDPQHTGPIRNVANHCYPCESTVVEIHDDAVAHRDEALLIKTCKLEGTWE